MKYYCDTEFTSFDGALLSIALVPEDENAPSFYEQLRYSPGDIHPWVAKNVLPHMEENKWNANASEISTKLRHYLMTDNDITIIADWPEDFIHFWRLLLVGPGQMIAIDNVNTLLKRTKKWSTADHSKVPHHALHDAIALRDYWKNK